MGRVCVCVVAVESVCDSQRWNEGSGGRGDEEQTAA